MPLNIIQRENRSLDYVKQYFSKTHFLILSDQKRWQDEADLNGNGEITNSEMREYLSSSDFEDFCGVKINDVSAKVFNEFWSAIDANVGNRKLDEDELKRATLQMEAIKEVNTFIDKKMQIFQVI